MKRVAIYLRVSTSKQDTDNQRRELEAVAARSGWHVERVYEDAGISGAKGRDKRPGLDAMLKAVNTKEFDMVATWSVDRLGRSLTGDSASQARIQQLCRQHRPWVASLRTAWPGCWPSHAPYRAPCSKPSGRRPKGRGMI